jgi:hypothetical protein
MIQDQQAWLGSTGKFSELSGRGVMFRGKWLKHRRPCFEPRDDVTS